MLIGAVLSSVSCNQKKNVKDEQENISADNCKTAYLELYKNRTVDFKIIFGYKDARPARFVADRYERMLFVQRILKPCDRSQYACGFSRSKVDADLFLKDIPGPDGQDRTVHLRVVQSSAGPDDEENRRDPFQKWRTRYATLAFLKSLNDGDVVFYNGHSRAGGGPDFEPPKIEPNQQVSFSWYKYHEPGLNQILGALEGAPSKLKLLGLYSCASSKHFLDKVSESKPELGLITSTRLIYFSDALESSIQALSSLLAMKCEGDFQSALKERKARAGGARVSGFFNQKSQPKTK